MSTGPGREGPTVTVPHRHRLTELEATVGSPYGLDPLADPLPPPSGASLRGALESRLLEALRRPPCLVPFSGGRDSSTVLALADSLARAEGLPAPIPITHRFPGVEETEETEWQEMLVARLGSTDWVKLTWTDELDIIGPYAARVLRRHGQVMPFNAHFLSPMAERARGGSLLTGIGGDELFGPVDRRVLAALLFSRRRPRRSELTKLAAELAPARIRIARASAKHPFQAFSWLRPDARAFLAKEFARTYAMPLRWDASIDLMWRTRYVQCSRSTLAALGGDHGARVSAPFLDPALLSDFAAVAGARGLGKRESSLPALVGDLLPPELLDRRTKSTFDSVFFNRHARAFARAWDGAGLDHNLVDPEALRSEWSRERPNPNTFSLLQMAWRKQDRAEAPGPQASASA